MNQMIKQISKDIRSGRLLEENIPKLLNRLANHYNTNTGVRLAMHYFSFYEAFCDDEDSWSTAARETTKQLNQIIKDHILHSQSGVEHEEAIQTIDAIRKDIMKRMDALTAFTDIFQTYEHVLNRLEYRFHGKVEAIEEEEFAKEILRYIFDSEDNMIINEKIKDIIGQLPIRMTKQKYFELLKNSINAYLGTDTSALDSYLYMLRTSAMLYQEEGMESLYPELWEKKEFLSHMAYKDISKENYKKALSILQAVTLFMEMETTLYYSLAEITNEVYALLLCAPYEGMVPSETTAAEQAVLQILHEINRNFLKSEKIELSEDLLEKFTDMEGIQEDMSFEIVTLEDALYEVKVNHKPLIDSLMLKPLLQVLLLSQDLLSNSLFINLEEDNTTENIVDEAKVNKETKALEEQLSVLFRNHDRMIGRAVMANTINKMPVFFVNHKEVMDYVLYSLERCSDEYEKSACVEIINEIMSD